MYVTEDRSSPPGGMAAEALAQRLSEAVEERRNGNGTGGGRETNGNGRKVALEVCFSMLADASEGTAEHSDDVLLISEAIGTRMGVSGAEFTDLLAAARLHDIGKAWVPTDLLEKPGPLTPEERHVMRQHTLVGERILKAVDELEGVAELVRHSHERWDGGGYPDGLAALEIPLGSRIIFCADAFHAIRCDRPYRRGRSARAALAEVKRCAGTQFDPHVAEALEAVVHERNRQPRKGGGSSRLFALLMCLVIGGAGSAVARSGALGDPGPQPPGSSQTPPGCGTAACPTVAGPVGGLGAVPALYGEPGPRPLFPGLPGQLHRATAPGQLKQRGEPAEGRGHGKAKHGKAKGHNAEKPGKHKGHSAEHVSQVGSAGGSSSQGSSHSSSSGGSSSAGHRSSGSSHRSGGSRRGGSRSRGHGGGGNSGGNGGGNAGGNSGGSPQGGGGGNGGGSNGH